MDQDYLPPSVVVDRTVPPEVGDWLVPPGVKDWAVPEAVCDWVETSAVIDWDSEGLSDVDCEAGADVDSAINTVNAEVLSDVIGKEVLEAKVDCNAVPSTVDCEVFDVTSSDEPRNHIRDYKML